MRKLWAGISSLFLSGLWWLIDKAYGDQLFAAIKPLVPADWLVLQNATSLALTYGPIVLLALLGVWLIRSALSRPDQGEGDSQRAAGNRNALVQGPVHSISTGDTHIYYGPPPQPEATPQAIASEFTPLPEAARRAYEAMRGVRSDLLEHVERKASEYKPSSPLPVCAEKIVLSYGVTLYGRREPSTVRELVSGDDFIAVDFSRDASFLFDIDGHKVWTNLEVKEAELVPILKAIEEGRTAGLVGRSAEQSTKPPEPEEPSSVFNLYDLLARVKGIRLRPGIASKDDIVASIYDRLRQGSLRAWGRKSNEYPPVTSHPRPLRRLIESSFWSQNTIEELDYWLRQPHFQHNQPTQTTTKPVSGDRTTSLHYWDLVFSYQDIQKLWPPQRV